jgi:hypothetical protein
MNGAAGSATSWFGRPVAVKSSSCASACSIVPVASGGFAPAGMTNVGEELEDERLGHRCCADARPLGDGHRRRGRSGQPERGVRGRRPGAGGSEPEELRQRDEVLAMGRRRDAALARLVVLIEGQDVADERVELEQQVAKARNVEVGPLREDRADEVL